MKKSIILILIIGLILFWGTFRQTSLLKEASSEATHLLTDISNSLDSPEDAKKIYQDYKNKWKKVKESLSLIIAHDEIDQIALHNNRLYYFLWEGVRADSLAEIGELKSIYTELYEKFKISFKNIL